MCRIFYLCTLKWPFINIAFVFKLTIFSVHVPLFHYTSCLTGISTHPIIIWYCKTICTALHWYLLLVLCASFAGYDTYWYRPWLSLKYFKVTENKGQLSYAIHKAVKNITENYASPLWWIKVWNMSGILYQTTTNMKSEPPPPSLPPSFVKVIIMWYIIFQLTHLLPSTTTNFIGLVDACYMFQLYWIYKYVSQ